MMLHGTKTPLSWTPPYNKSHKACHISNKGFITRKVPFNRNLQRNYPVIQRILP
jgi:hypothetical protein